MAQLPMPTIGGGMHSDPGGHIALARADPRFMPLSLHCVNRSRDPKSDPRFILSSSNPPSKEKEPPDLIQVFLFPVPVLTTSYHDPDAAAILKLHKLESWPE